MTNCLRLTGANASRGQFWFVQLLHPNLWGCKINARHNRFRMRMNSARAAGLRAPGQRVLALACARISERASERAGAHSGLATLCAPNLEFHLQPAPTFSRPKSRPCCRLCLHRCSCGSLVRLRDEITRSLNRSLSHSPPRATARSARGFRNIRAPDASKSLPRSILPLTATCRALAKPPARA